MIVPIIGYGHKILRNACNLVNKTDAELESVIDNLWDTLDASGGVGLAAPQINSSEKIFVINSRLMYEELSDKQRNECFAGDHGIKEVFVNAQIVERSESTWKDIEGCLSLPGINEPVERSWQIKIKYQDINLNRIEKSYSGYTARVIQHEYDHLNGILFIDHLSGLKKKMLQGKIKQILSGKVDIYYKMSWAK